MNKFLRTFHGHNRKPSCSLARFKFEDLNQVLQLINDDGQHTYSYTTHIGRHELDGKYCIRLCGSGRWICFRRKNGEPSWNICGINSQVFEDFLASEMNAFYDFLTNNGIEIQMPKYSFEYIPPITEDESKKYIVGTRGWSATDSVSVLESQEYEKKWYNAFISDGTLSNQST